MYVQSALVAHCLQCSALYNGISAGDCIMRSSNVRTVSSATLLHDARYYKLYLQPRLHKHNGGLVLDCLTVSSGCLTVSRACLTVSRGCLTVSRGCLTVIEAASP